MPTNVTRISRFGFVNAYLVSEDDGLTLVDTLVPRSAKASSRAAEGLGAPIVRIALTHAHGDHIGSLDDARRGAARRRGPHLGPRRPPAGARTSRWTPASRRRKLRGSYPGAETRPTRTLAAGRPVGSLEVVAAPGHTPGHVAFFDTPRRARCCAATRTRRSAASRPRDKVRLPFPLASMATWDPATELESARALRALEPAAAGPGHGKHRRGAGSRHGRRDRQGVRLADAARRARHRSRRRRRGRDRGRRGPRRRHAGAGGRRAGRPRAVALQPRRRPRRRCCARWPCAACAS